MLRYISIIVIFLGCTFIGFYIGEIYKRRFVHLSELFKSVLLLNNEVMYSHTALPEAFINVSNKIKSPVSDLYSNMANDLISGECANVYQSYKKNKKIESTSLNLEEEDERVLEHFFKNIGESLVYGQDKIFTLTIESLKMNCARAEKSATQNTKLFRRVGICVGAIMVIFLI